MTTLGRARVDKTTTWGLSKDSFWVEYPSGLVDLTRTPADETEEPVIKNGQFELDVLNDRRLRITGSKSAVVVVDMQNFFLHPDLRAHPLGLQCVDPLLKVVPHLRDHGVKIIWCNWGLTDAELSTIPPALTRSFSKTRTPAGQSGFGSQLPGNFGRLLMRGEHNSELYGPLQKLYLEGKEKGTDVWVHKNRMSGIWGGQSELDLLLQNLGIKTAFFAGVNADQCVLGTVVDAYFKGYDCILLEDCVATSSPEGGKSNIVYNCMNSYGFVTDTSMILE